MSIVHRLLFLFFLTTVVSGQIIYFNSTNLFPLGFDWDPTTSRFLLGSLSRPSLATLTLDGQISDFASDLQIATADVYILGVRVYANTKEALVTLPSSKATQTSSYVASFNLSTLRSSPALVFTSTPLLAGIYKDQVSPNLFYTTDPIRNLLFVYNTSSSSAPRAFSNSTVFFETAPVDSTVTTGTWGVDGYNGYFVVSSYSRQELYRSRGTQPPYTYTRVTLPAGLTLTHSRFIRFNSRGQLAVATQDRLYVLTSSDDYTSATVAWSYPLDASADPADVTWVENDPYVLYSYVREAQSQTPRDIFKIEKATQSTTPAPTPAPTSAPTAAPTAAPTVLPGAPTPAPSVAPTSAPGSPTPAPTTAPTSAPGSPTPAPSPAPTSAPGVPTPAPAPAPTPAPGVPTPAPAPAPTPAPGAPTPSPTPQASTPAPSPAPTSATVAPTTRSSSSSLSLLSLFAVLCFSLFCLLF